MKGIVALFITLCVFVTPLSSQAASPTLDQIEKSGKIRIGYRDSEPPMSFLDADGKPVGYSIDLCSRIVTGVKNKLDTEVGVEFVPVTAKDRFSALTDNKIDILCGSTTKTLSRSKLVDFTLLTFVTGASLMTLQDFEIRELSDLNGKKVGAVKGTTTIDVLKKMFKETLTDATVVPLNSAAEALDGLRDGKIAAFSADQVVLIGLVMNAKDQKKFAIASDVFSFEPFALAVRRNDADFRLEADRVLSQLYRSGQILQIYDKWFGEFSDKRSPLFDALYQLNVIPE